MNKKGMYIFRVILGGYLGYLGINLLVQTAKEKPSNMIFMSVMGALFVVVGVVYAIFSLKRVLDLRKEDESDGSQAETEGDVTYEEDASRRVDLQTVGSDQISDITPVSEEITDAEKEEKDDGIEKQSSGTEGKNADTEKQPSDKENHDSDEKAQKDEEIENDYEEK